MRQLGNPRSNIGVFLLLWEMYNMGYNQIPIVTLTTILLQVFLFTGIIKVPWNITEICISSETVLKQDEFKRLFFSVIAHADDLHLYYNMISYLFKGRSLENRYGSANFAILLAALTFLTSIMYVALGEIGYMIFGDKYYIKVCAIGFSGVIFALKVVTSCEEPARTTVILGIPVSTEYAAWLELVLIHVMVPRVSFMGHLGGILAGLLYTRSPIGIYIDNVIYFLTGDLIIHEGIID